jgi:hypothetical protein
MNIIDLTQKFSKERRELIINHKADKYMQKGWFKNFQDAYKRAKMEMMLAWKYSIFSKIALLHFKVWKQEATYENLEMSTNRNGQHSWYLKYVSDGESSFTIRISDHFTYHSSSKYQFIVEKDIITEYLLSEQSDEWETIGTYKNISELKNLCTIITCELNFKLSMI